MKAFLITFWLAGALGAATIPPEAWTRDVAATGYEDGAPVGGFGAGTVSWTYKGNFYKNRLILGNDPDGADAGVDPDTDPDCGFYMYQKAGAAASTWRRLSSAMGAGQASYASLFPKSWVSYTGSNFACKATVTQFSPIIPGDYQRSSYPVAIYVWDINNPTGTATDVAIMLTWRNEFNGTAIQAVSDATKTGVRFSRGAASATNEDQGEFSIAVKPPAGVTATIEAGASLAALEGSFSPDGVLTNGVGAQTRGALAFKVTVPAGGSVQVPMVLTWDLPIHQVGTGNKWYKRYTRYFTRTGLNSWAMAQDALDNWTAWLASVDSWQQGVLSNAGYPNWLKTMLFNELYYYFAGGTVWEAGAASGQPDDPAEDMFSHLETYIYDFYGTSDVRFYGSWPMILLWPDIDKQAVRQFCDSVTTSRTDRPPPLGTTAHDFGARNSLFTQWNAYIYRDSTTWKDLNSKLVLMVYRDWKLTGQSDSAFLTYCWPAVQMAMAKVKSQDSDADGLPNSAGIDQTYDDMDLTGDTAYCGGLFLAACRAAKEIALAMGNNAQANTYQAWYDLGAPNYESQLWNGSYYKIDTGSFDTTRVMSDQLCGQWYAKACGLQGIVSDARAASAFTQVFNRNVMGFDGGAHGACNVMNAAGSIDTSTPQTQECWVGTSWGLAAGMLQEGLTAQVNTLGQGLYNSIYNSGQFWFRTPEAWRTGLGAMRAPYYMRATTVWAVKHAYDNTVCSPGPCSPTPSPTRSRTFTPSPSFSPSPTSSPTPCGTPQPVVRVDVGDTNAFTDGLGNVWSADQAYVAGGWGYMAGTAASTASAIAGTLDDDLFQDERWNPAPLEYRFTVPNGPYRVRLLHCEIYYTGTNQRRFTITVEGQTAINNIDLVASPGALNAYESTIDVTVSDGVLNVIGSASVDNPQIAAIEVLSLASLGCPSPTFSATRTLSSTPSRTASPSPTATASATMSATPTGSPSASPSGTRTASPSPSASASLSPSRSPSASSTLTASGTMSFTATASPSPSRTATASPSATPTFSPTASGTRTVTPTGSPSPTPSFSHSPTISPSFTASPPFSHTVSPTITLSSTRSPTPSASPSSTDTVSPSRTASPSGTPSASPSLTATSSASPTVTASPSLSPSFSVTPTVTETPTVSPTFTISPPFTATISPAFSLTATVSPTPTHSASASPTATLSRTATASATPSASPTLSVTPSITLSFTASPPFSATQSPSHSPSFTATPVISATPTPTITCACLTPTPSRSVTTGAGPAPGPLAIEEAALAPNPAFTKGALYVAAKLKGRATRLRLRIYSQALACVADFKAQGSFGPGWSGFGLSNLGVAGGLYFYKLEASDGSATASWGPGKLLLLP